MLYRVMVQHTYSLAELFLIKLMINGLVFSWAENADGQMVHVDDVPRGLNCGCTCPNCHEKLLARHGDVNEHGFAHHSETRGANLKICYMVVMYKLAEQIIQRKKRIHAPSYFGIYKDQDIEFVEVKTDSLFEREDKQPDVIATTNDGKQYLIEFVFRYKVQHKKAINYKNLTCLEVDLSNQTLEALETFLLSSAEDRQWLNNELYFKKIEEIYRNAGRNVKPIPTADCITCELRNDCCALRYHSGSIVVENSGERYRLCDRDEFNHKLETEKQRQIEAEKIRQEEKARREELKRIEEERNKIRDQSEERTCFKCQCNLEWACKDDGWCFCGCYKSVGLPRQRVNPDYAKQCRGFKWK